MTTQRRITRPGMYDNEFMTVTCTPDVTAVEFFEHQAEAEDAARNNLHPSTTTYVGRVIKQGEHAVKPTASHVAVLVEVDDELRRALAHTYGVPGRPQRKVVAAWLNQILQRQLEAIRGVYRDRMNEEHTQPGAPTPTDAVARPPDMLMRLAQPHIDRAHASIQLAKARCSPHGAHPPVISCHPGNRCSNWPECEFCGPPRL